MSGIRLSQFSHNWLFATLACLVVIVYSVSIAVPVEGPSTLDERS
jgi:hypothetical protein